MQRPEKLTKFLRTISWRRRSYESRACCFSNQKIPGGWVHLEVTLCEVSSYPLIACMSYGQCFGVTDFTDKCQISLRMQGRWVGITSPLHCLVYCLAVMYQAVKGEDSCSGVLQ